MIPTALLRPRSLSARTPRAGFTLIELMVALAISMLIMLALVALFVNASRSNAELAKTNTLVENGRFALQLLQNDLLHAGFWGGFLPDFDNLSASMMLAPGDVPTAIPDPCTPFANWDSAFRTNLIGIAVEATATLPDDTGCIGMLPQRAGTDVLIVRHADTCSLQWNAATNTWILDPTGSGNCEPFQNGRAYMQNSFCTTERQWAAQSAGANTLQLPTNAMGPVGAYVGTTIRAVGGTGAGQSRLVAAYSGNAAAGGDWTATLDTPWTTIPDATTQFNYDYGIDDGAVFPLRQRNCDNTYATRAPIRRLVSHIYYISDIAHPDRAGETIPTLVRSELEFAGGVLAQQAPEPLIEGIQELRIELGIDNRMTRCGLDNAVNYAAPLATMASCNPAAQAGSVALPTNRGDGIPDLYLRCTDTVPCSAAQLTDALAAKIYLLARSREPTLGYSDDKTYCLGEPAADGSCPPANQVGPFNDGYKRHAFTSAVRFVNVSGRRESP